MVVAVYGQATKLVAFILCIWFGYKLAIFIQMSKKGKFCPVNKSQAKLVTLYKTLTVTETQTTTLESTLVTTSYSTITLASPREEEPGRRHALSHVVIPLAYKPYQMERLSKSLRFWDLNLPCLQDSWPNRPGESNITLTILSYTKLTQGQRRNVEDLYWKLNRQVRRCFVEFEILCADLAEATDDHLGGSRAMFETIITNRIQLKSPQYVFWMEPDAVPIRPDWLNALDRSCRTQEAFWVKGSAPRHALQKEVVAKRYGTHFLYHINGNALYNMAPNGYPSFYTQNLLPYMERKGVGSRFAFDVALARYLLDPENSDVWREIAHYFQYTSLIQNRWGENYSVFERAKLFPETFLIHGGTPQDP